MARELYIYWKAPGTIAAQARELVQAMQQGLREQHPKLTARLLRRPEESQGLVTWMEVYAAPPPGITPALHAAIEAAAAPAMATLGIDKRHVEAFDAL